MKGKLQLSLFAMMFVTVGCIGMGRKFTTDDVSKIRPCETTKEDLKKMFGKPRLEGIQGGHRTMQWMFAKSGVMGIGMEVGNLVVYLNDKGKVVDYAMNPTTIVDIKDECK